MGSLAMMLEAFHFLRPWWLLLLPALMVATAVLWRRHGRWSPWAQVCDPELLEQLSLSSHQRQRVAVGLLWLGAALAILALAGPAWRQLPQPLVQAPVAQVLVLDLSKSMDAGDQVPSRLVRARFVANDVLKAQQEGGTGLVAFAGDAFAVAPITSDRKTVRHLLESLEPDLMPVQGGNIAAGLLRAKALFDNAVVTRGRVLLLTDSKPDADALSTAEALAVAGHTIVVIGFGTAEGAPIPIAGGGWMKDSEGAIVVPSLDSGALSRLARAGAGHYFSAASYHADAPSVLAAAMDHALDGRIQQTDQWQDEGVWLMLPLLLCAALGFRRGWLAVVLVAVNLGGLSSPAEAFSWEDLWLRADQQAYQALQQGQIEAAAEQFQNPEWKAAARYRQGEYADAAALLESSDQAQALYNRGNALARAGELAEALSTYEQSLKQNPDDADAVFNRDLVKRLLEQQQQADQQQGGSSEQQDDTEQSQNQQGQQSQSEGQDAQSDSEQEGQQQNQGDSESQGQSSDQPQSEDAESSQAEPNPDAKSESDQQQAKTESTDEAEDPQASEAQLSTAQQQADDREQQESQMAVEQWLRRVPDDPGGLLRRKFARQYQRREQEQQQEQQW